MELEIILSLISVPIPIPIPMPRFTNGLACPFRLSYGSICSKGYYARCHIGKKWKNEIRARQTDTKNNSF